MEWDNSSQYITNEVMIRDMSIVVQIIVIMTPLLDNWCENSLFDVLWEDARCWGGVQLISVRMNVGIYRVSVKFPFRRLLALYFQYILHMMCVNRDHELK